MKKTITRILSLLMASALCFGLLTACDSGPSGETSNNPQNSNSGVEIPQYDFKLGCVLYSLTDSVTVNIMNGLQSYCDMFGIELVVVQGENADGNLQAIENLIAADVDGIFMHSAQGLEGWISTLEAANMPFVLGGTKVMTDEAKAAIEESDVFLGQVDFDQYEVMETVMAPVLASGTTEIGLIAPTNITPNYLGARKQAVLDIVEDWNASNDPDITIREGTGSSYFDFAGFTSSLLANYPELEYLVTVTTGDSAYQPILMAEKEGKVKLYASNRTENAEAAMSDGTLQSFVAGTEHIAPEFLIMLHHLTGNDFVADGYVDLTTPILYVDSLDTYHQFDQYYNNKVLYSAEFLMGIDSLDKLEAMASAATLENFVSGEYLNID